MFGECIFDEIFGTCFYCAIHKQVVINALRRNEHEREIHRIIFRAYVFRCFVNAIFQVLFEYFFKFFLFRGVVFRDNPIVVLKREFGIYGNYFIFHKNDGVRNKFLASVLIVPKPMLHFV